jgi:hypothetical protein
MMMAAARRSISNQMISFLRFDFFFLSKTSLDGHGTTPDGPLDGLASPR